MSAPILYAYIDETGDRGMSLKASEWFALVGVVTAAEDVSLQRVFINGMRQEYNVPGALHWVEHFKPKQAERRRHAATALSALPNRVVVSLAHKPCMSVMTHAGMADDGSKFYNFAYRLLMERICHVANEWPGGPRQVKVLADSVKGMNHKETEAYLRHVRDVSSYRDRYRAPWGRAIWPPTWHSSEEFEGLQMADLYASSLGAALNKNLPEWFIPWSHQVRASGSSNVWKRGFKCASGCVPGCLPPGIETTLT